MTVDMLSMEITLGNILTVTSILGGWLIFMTGLKGKLDLLNQALHGIERRLVFVETAISNLNQATIQIARQEVRMEGLEARILDLEHDTKK